jgi:hypothetical protein
MRIQSLLTVTLACCLTGALGIQAAEVKAPTKPLIFKGKPKDVPFDHTSHVKSMGGKCAPCHESGDKGLWPQKFDQSLLKFKGGAMHKNAIEAKESCAHCHHANSQVKGAFDIKGNCTQCHTGPK